MGELACFRIVEFDEYQKKHIMLMREIARAVTRADTEKKFVLKGGTGLLLAYRLPRFSTDLDFDGKNPAFDISSVIREGAERTGIPIESLKKTKNTEIMQKYMMHYLNKGQDVHLKIDLSYRDTSQFDENDVRLVDGIRVYSAEKICDLKAEAFVARIKARDTYDIAYLFDKYPQEITAKTHEAVSARVGNMTMDYLVAMLEQEDILTGRDPEEVVLSLVENLEKLLKRKSGAHTIIDNESENTYSTELSHLQKKAGSGIQIKEAEVKKYYGPGQLKVYEKTAILTLKDNVQVAYDVKDLRGKYPPGTELNVRLMRNNDGDRGIYLELAREREENQR